MSEKQVSLGPPCPPPSCIYSFSSYEIFREVWDYFHKENLNPLPTSCPVMRSPVSEGESVKCHSQGGAERDVERSVVGG